MRTPTTITTHNQGRCWPPTCPVCDNFWTVHCDGCPTQTSDPTTCQHGRSLCPACVDENPCRDCTREAKDR